MKRQVINFNLKELMGDGGGGAGGWGRATCGFRSTNSFIQQNPGIAFHSFTTPREENAEKGRALGRLNWHINL